MVLCFVLFTYILANEHFSGEICSYALKRKMLIEHCGNIRKRRAAYTYSEITNEKSK